MEEKLGIRTKKCMLDELKKSFKASPDFIVTRYEALASKDMEKLRKDLLKVKSRYFVVKNSIAKRAFNELGHQDLNQFLNGSVGIGFTNDIINAAKALVGFSKEHKGFKLRSAFIAGKIEAPDRIKYLAALPSREALLSMAIGYMKSPITGFVGVLSNLVRSLVTVINEIKNKKSKEGKEGGK